MRMRWHADRHYRSKEEKREKKDLSVTAATVNAAGVLMQVMVVTSTLQESRKKRILTESVDTWRQVVVVDTGEYRWCMHGLVCETESKVSNI